MTEDKEKGETLSEADLIELRPCPEDSIPLSKINEIIGKRLKKSIKKGGIFKMGRSDIAIIIPAFNEEKSIENIVTSCTKYGEVIVINDGSNDKTSYKATKAGSLVLNHSKKKGYDAALNTGFNYAFQKKYKFLLR